MRPEERVSSANGHPTTINEGKRRTGGNNDKKVDGTLENSECWRKRVDVSNAERELALLLRLAALAKDPPRPLPVRPILCNNLDGARPLMRRRRPRLRGRGVAGSETLLELAEPLRLLLLLLAESVRDRPFERDLIGGGALAAPGVWEEDERDLGAESMKRQEKGTGAQSQRGTHKTDTSKYSDEVKRRTPGVGLGQGAADCAKHLDISPGPRWEARKSDDALKGPILGPSRGVA